MARATRIAAAIAALAPAAAHGHSQSRSYSIWEVEGRRVGLYVELDALDVRESVLVDLDRDGRLTEGEVAASQERLAGILDSYADVSVAGARCRRDGATASELAGPADRVLLRARWRCDEAVTTLTASLRLAEALAVAAHRNLANFHLPGGTTESHVFAPGDDAVVTFDVYQPPEQRSAWGAFRVYALLGVEHILAGWDHLLFLAALLLVWPATRELLLIVSSFTVAHSLTLALATLDVVSPPAAAVEAVIAASIAYVAVENVLRAAPGRRWLLTFGFGLVHGFGFSGVLRELGLPEDHLVASLLAFNVGVEVGQIGVVLPASLLLALGRRRLSQEAVRRVTRGASLAVLAPALYWLALRVGVLGSAG